jgi:hypothetical protein
MLTELDGKTLVTAAMEHSYFYYGETMKEDAAKAIKTHVEKVEARVAEGKKDVWEFGFVPKLRELVEEN